jgi:hypothetical protein
VIESDAPRKLVQTYRFLFNDAMKSEGFTGLTYEISPTKCGFCRLRMVRMFGVQRLHHVADRELVDVDHLARERREPEMSLEPTRAAPARVHLVRRCTSAQ